MANVEVKAHRLARWGRVEITGRTLNTTIATVEGDSGTYEVTIYPELAYGATCQCGAFYFNRDCSHIRAVCLYESYGAIWQAEQRAKQREADWKVTH